MNFYDKKIKIFSYTLNYYKKDDREKLESMKKMFKKCGYTCYINVIRDDNNKLRTSFVIECLGSNFSDVSDILYFWGAEVYDYILR